jgi:hypothetical protein
VASRAEPVLAAAPGLRAAVRVAATDFYFNSWRLVPANLLWGAVFIGLLVGSSLQPAVAVLAPLLAVPTVGIFRMAALVARGEGATFRDGLAAWQTMFVPTLLLGMALAGCAVVLIGNIALGLLNGGVVGWSLATLAAWGLLATWVVGWTAWPLLVDPARANRPVQARLRIAVLLVVAEPGRMAALGVLLAILIAASAVAFAALVSISVAFAALVVSRYVLPAADRLEARLGDPRAARST